MKYMERRGSGLRKMCSETEKLPGYTEAYKPEFFSTSADFRVILKNVNNHLRQKNLVSAQDKLQDIPRIILDFCMTEKSKKEICSLICYRNNTYFTRKYLKLLLTSGQLKMTVPGKKNEDSLRNVFILR